MNSKILKVIIPSALALLLFACAASSVRNVQNAPIDASSSKYDLSEVTKAIQRAGIVLGWQMKSQTPGHIVGRLYLRTHVAVVDITYTLDEYSINYKDSTNLEYDAGNHTIHRAYNGWIQNLTNAMNAHLVGI